MYILKDYCIDVHISWEFSQNFAFYKLTLVCVFNACHLFSNARFEFGHCSIKHQIKDSVLARLCFTKELESDMQCNSQYGNPYNKKASLKINEHCRLLKMISILWLQYIYKIISKYISYTQHIFLYKVFMQSALTFIYF